MHVINKTVTLFTWNSIKTYSIKKSVMSVATCMETSFQFHLDGHDDQELCYMKSRGSHASLKVLNYY